MIDHVTVHVSDWARSMAFYLGALAPLGYEVVMELSREEFPDLPAARFAGLGVNGKPDLWLRQAESAPTPGHVAIAAADHETIKRFHAAGLTAGGRDNGAPGPRPEYHPGYFGAFLLDPDGHNIEAVCHRPV